jgi:hypothetical protein
MLMVLETVLVLVTMVFTIGIWFDASPILQK